MSDLREYISQVKKIKELKKKAKDKKWDEEVAKFFSKEVKKLSRLNPAAGEYSVQFAYCQTLLDLPWNEYSEDKFDLKRAQKILDRHWLKLYIGHF